MIHQKPIMYDTPHQKPIMYDTPHQKPIMYDTPHQKPIMYDTAHQALTRFSIYNSKCLKSFSSNKTKPC